MSPPNSDDSPRAAEQKRRRRQGVQLDLFGNVTMNRWHYEPGEVLPIALYVATGEIVASPRTIAWCEARESVRTVLDCVYRAVSGNAADLVALGWTPSLEEMWGPNGEAARSNISPPSSPPLSPTQPVVEVRDREACVYGCRICT